MEPHGGWNPEHTDVRRRRAVVGREVELLRSPDEEVSGCVTADLGMGPVGGYPEPVGLGPVLTVVQACRRVGHVVGGAEFEGAVCKAVRCRTWVHEGRQHHGDEGA